MTNKKKNNCCNLILEYLYLIWDGMVFFGHDDNKLQRLRGIKPHWYDRFLNKRWLIFNLTFVFIGYYILYEHSNLLGTVMSQQLNNESFNERTLSVNDTLATF